MAPADAVARALRGRRQGQGWLCRCQVPGHGRGRGYKTPSLSVVTGRDGASGFVSKRLLAREAR